MIYCMYCGQMMPEGHSAAHGVTQANDPWIGDRLHAAIMALVNSNDANDTDDMIADLAREQRHFGTELDAHRNLDGTEDVYDARLRRKDAGLLW